MAFVSSFEKTFMPIIGTEEYYPKSSKMANCKEISPKNLNKIQVFKIGSIVSAKFKVLIRNVCYHFWKMDDFVVHLGNMILYGHESFFFKG